MTSVGAWLTDALAARSAGEGAVARLDCELLLSHLLKVPRTTLLARPETPIPEAALAPLNDGVDELRRGVSVFYLLGRREFWGIDFKLTRDVLVPRPDTELLVESTLKHVAAGQRVVDLGTGSGAIAVALASEVPSLDVTASDCSAAALTVARANADAAQVRCRFVRADWWQGLNGTFDVVVSNPPYIRADDPHLAALQDEPALALVGGEDGLAALRKIIDGAPAHLADNGWLLLEHGYDQGAAVRDLCRQAGFGDVHTLKDLGGQERVTLGRLRR